ncbi:MAG: polymer-forming cytoskeletal protein [Parcubacteria group bacterium]
MKKIVILAIIFISVPFVAFGVTKSQDTVFVAADETIEENLFAYGSMVTVDGDVNGDLIAIAQTVRVSGHVAGDILVLANDITLNGAVDGNVRALGQSVNIGGKVARNVSVAGNSVTLASKADVGWSMTSTATATDIQGAVRGNILGYGGNITITGTIDGNATFTTDAASVITLQQTATIEGDLTYTAENDVITRKGAEVLGATTHHLPTQNIKDVKALMNSFGFIVKLLGWFGLLFAGVLLVSLFPRHLIAIGEVAQRQLWRSIAYGLLVIVLTPLVAILLFLSIVGIPTGFILLTLYFMVMYGSRIVTGTMLGNLIITKFRKSESPPLWSMLLGTTLIVLASSLPYIGWIVSLISMLFGVGALVVKFRPGKTGEKPVTKIG